MSKKLTIIDIIERANEKHNYYYKYDLNQRFENNKSKIVIECPKHGKFEQRIDQHLRGSKCKKCSNNIKSINSRKTNEKFISEAKIIHKNKYDYSNVEYITSNVNINIICPEHGEFKQTPNSHLKGNGCKKCGIIKNSFNNRLTEYEFIKKANKIHNNKYDYSLVEYITINDKVNIICPEHGEFNQVANSHLRGFGCKKCGVEKRSSDRKKNRSYFIKRAKIVHENKYDYSKIEFNKPTDKVKIICPEHGEFIQKLSDHINNKAGCQKCKKDILSLGIDEFINRSNLIHENKYDYSISEYQNTYTNIKIICPEHGIFEQSPHSHLKGFGCKNCGRSISKNEKDLVNWLKNDLKIKNIIENDRKILTGKELDVYLPDFNFAIELNGLYWHSEKYKSNNYHLDKTNECESKGVQLLHIFEDEWIEKKNIIKSIIKSKLGLITNRIYARKCIIKEISSKQSKEFLEKNHIQGNVNSSIKLGLFYNDELVSLMSFSKTRSSMKSKELSYDLNRFCNKLNTNVIGGAGKLLEYFKRNYNYEEIISFADKRISNGKLYEKLKFGKSHIIKPDYCYFNNKENIRYHRFNYRKDNLIKLGYDVKNKTEHEIMISLNYLRIYDCGKIKYNILK